MVVTCANPTAHGNATIRFVGIHVGGIESGTMVSERWCEMDFATIQPSQLFGSWPWLVKRESVGAVVAAVLVSCG